MPFPLAAIGAGLGQGAQQISQQQDTYIRQMMLAAHLQKMRFEMEKEGRATDASILAAGFSPGGGVGSLAGVGGIPSPGGAPQQAPPPYAQTPAGSGMSSGLGNPRDLVGHYESEGLAGQLGISPYNIGYGGTDVSGFPADRFGFPQWPGKMGPAGMSHAAGRYQFQPGTWARYAGPIGVSDFSQASQGRVFDAAHAKEGYRPWAPYNPKLAQAIGGGAASGTQTPAAPAPAAGQGATAQSPAVATPSLGEPPMPPSTQDIARLMRGTEAGRNVPTRTLMQAAAEVHDREMKDYKLKLDVWKAREQIGGERESRGETARANRAREAGVDKGFTFESGRLNESIRAAQATEADRKEGRKLEGGRLDVSRQQADTAATRAQAQVETKRRQLQLETTQLDTLADQARQLANMAQQVQSVTGARGVGERVAGSVLGQVGINLPEHPVVADFKSKLQLLQSQLQANKEVFNTRNFSGPAIARMNQLLPGLGAMDDPTKVTTSLLNVAEMIETASAARKHAGQVIQEDVSRLSDDDIRRQLGIGAPAAPQ